ncbi:hypothetical protein [Alcanivorax sp. 1008]|uniref:hypothetical protein n=1 Tax=Alcanivorax sp. 1008 TaxID=2816853 RepID=UPI001D95032A|nr:hypothetical protein [Alcanivorax sp. 1008]MCC1496760.1 hypothetical protein [Alcanivorax sp. 1008]
MSNTTGRSPNNRVTEGNQSRSRERRHNQAASSGPGLFLGVGDGLRVTPKKAFSPISVAEVVSNEPYVLTVTRVERADDLALKGLRVATIPSRVLYFDTTRDADFPSGRNWIFAHGASARAVEMSRGKGQSLTVRPHPDAASEDIRRSIESGFTVRFTGEEDDMGAPVLAVAADAPWVVKPLESVGKDWWRSPMRCWMTALEEDFRSALDVEADAQRYLAALALENLAGDMFRERVRQIDRGKLPSDQYTQFRELQDAIGVLRRQEEARLASPSILKALDDLVPEVLERVVSRANELNKELDPEAAPIGMNP